MNVNKMTATNKIFIGGIKNSISKSKSLLNSR